MKEILELKQIILTSTNSVNYDVFIHNINQKLKQIDQLRRLPNNNDENILSIFRKEIIEITNTSEFLKYILEKPRGYAGDFKTQEMIWLGRNKRLSLTNDDIGKSLTKLTLEMEACKANEIRINYLKKLLQEYQGKRIASLACGSAIELWNIDDHLLQGTDIFFLDQDEGALINAKRNINLNNSSLQFHQENIQKFIVGGLGVMGNRDLIYLVGLFDYFKLKSIKKIISKLWTFVKPQGEIMFTNAHPLNPTKLWMEYVVQWVLNYKTKEELLEVTIDLDNVKSIEYSIDDLNVYQYLRIRKK